MRYPYGRWNPVPLEGLVGFDYIPRDDFDIIRDFGRPLADGAGMYRNLGDVSVVAWDVGLRVRRHGTILADCLYTEVCELRPGGIGTDGMRRAAVETIAAHGWNPGDYALAFSPRCFMRATEGNAAVVAEVRRRHGAALAFYAAEEERLGRWRGLRTEGNARQWQAMDDLYNLNNLRSLSGTAFERLDWRLDWGKVAALARRCIHRVVCRGEGIGVVHDDLMRRIADGRGLRSAGL